MQYPLIKRIKAALCAIAREDGLLLFLLLAFIFLITGTIGRDPWWKKGEAYSFGIIYHFFQTGTWLVPMNAGVPFLEKPPLYYWTATITCRLFPPLLSLHDAARLATTFYMIITTVFVWLSGKTIFRLYPEKAKTLAWTSTLLFLSTYGVSLYGHALITDMALIAGTAITMYGLILLCKLPEQWIRTGLCLGIGIGVVFLSKGFVLPAILGISGIIMSIISPRFRWHLDMIKGISFSLFVTLPFLVIWPWLLYQAEPGYLKIWLWDNNIGRFLGHSVAQLGAANRRENFFVMLPVFAFPIFPLACIEIFLGRKEWHRTEYLLPLIISLVGIFILLASASFRTVYLMPLFPGLTLLATQGLMRLPERFFVYWNKVVRIGFSAFAIGTWIIWWNLLHPPGQRPVPWLVKQFDHIFPADFVPQEYSILAFLIAIVVSLFWISSFRIRENTPLSSARIFFTGVVLAWCTSHTLLMPWINETRSFRSVIANFQQFKRNSPHANDCVGNYDLGENMAPMLEYFMPQDIPKLMDPKHPVCPIFLTFKPRNAPEDLYPHWKLVWRGTRLLDIKDSEIRLYEQMKE